MKTKRAMMTLPTKGVWRRPQIFLACALLLPLGGCLDVFEVADEGAAPDLVTLQCPGGRPATECNLEMSGSRVMEFAACVNPNEPRFAVLTANDYGTPKTPLDVNDVRVHLAWGWFWITEDGGVTWRNQSIGGTVGSELEPWSGYEATGDMNCFWAHDGTLYLLGVGYFGPEGGMPFMLESRDNGASWRKFLVGQETGRVTVKDFPRMAVDHDGRIFVSWAEYATYDDVTCPYSVACQPDSGGGGTHLGISEDGGKTWEIKPFPKPETSIAPTFAIGPDNTIHVAYSNYSGQPQGVEYAYSTDHGRSWSTPSLLWSVNGTTSQKAPNATYYAQTGMPDLVVLPDDTVLVVAQNEREGRDGDIMLSTSRDRGVTWHTVPMTGDETTSYEVLPTVASDRAGNVVAAWLDRRDDPTNTGYRLYAALRQPDGTWHSGPVSAVTSFECAESDCHGLGKVIGDYIGAAIEGDQVYVTWPDLRVDGRSRLYAASLETTGSP